MIYAVIIIMAGCCVIKGSGRLEKDSRFAVNDRKRPYYIFTLEKLTVFLLLFLMWFLTAFRGETVGNDTAVYLGWFMQIGNGTVRVFGDVYLEKGFLAYLYIIAHVIGTYPQIVLIVSSAVCYVLIGHYIFAYSKNYYLSLCLVFCFLFSVFTNEMRQGLAAVIGVYGYVLLKKKKYAQSTGVLLLACAFHVSALAIFVLYLHKFFPQNLKKIYTWNTVLCVLSLGLVFNRILLSLFPRFSVYFSSERVGNGRLALFTEIAFSYLLLYFAHKAYKRDKRAHSLELAVFELYSFFFILALNMSLISRVTYFFSAILTAEIPNMIRQSGIRKKSMVSMLLSGLLLGWFLVVLLFRQSWNHLIPYEFWTNNILYR